MPYSVPEVYYFSPTPHVPNSLLPVLIYRSALPQPTTEASSRAHLEQHNWLWGGTFNAVTSHHFHSVTHECYGVFKGSSRLLLGRGPLDDEKCGKEVDVGVGDVIVLPAGVAHCSLSFEEGYEYVAVYPKGSPHWDNNWCKAGPSWTNAKTAKARAVPVPDQDPVFGLNGPLAKLWALGGVC